MREQSATWSATTIRQGDLGEERVQRFASVPGLDPTGQEMVVDGQRDERVPGQDVDRAGDLAGALAPRPQGKVPRRPGGYVTVPCDQQLDVAGAGGVVVRPGLPPGRHRRGGSGPVRGEQRPE